MRIPNESVFSPNSSFSSSLTRDQVDGIAVTVAQMDSPPPTGRTRRSPARKDTAQYKTARQAAVRRPSSTGTNSKDDLRKRILQYYAGNIPEAHIRTAHKLDEYSTLYGQLPIAPLGTPGQRGGESQLIWKCQICKDDFPTFQKAAVHLTSGEWGMPNWRCPENSWYVLSHSS